MNFNTIPKLRFPGFSGEWEKKKLGEVFNNSREKGNALIPIYSVTQKHGLIPRESIDRNIQNDAAPGDNLVVNVDWLTYNMMRMWQGAVGIAKVKCMVSPAYVVLKPSSITNSTFFLYLFERNRSLFLFKSYSHGLTLDRLRLYYDDFASIQFEIPILSEQQKIASFLSAVDEKLQELKKKKSLLDQYKKGVMQKIFSQELRFKDDDGNEFPEWEVKKLREVLKSISTKKHQINSTEFRNLGAYKVIDQGQDLIAGYSDLESKVFKDLPVIVFGDHTTILKYIDFEFIVGADGTKLLKAKSHNDLIYIFYNLQFNNVQQQGYKRHFTLLSEIYLQIPSLPEQTKIANFLSAIDEKIHHVQSQIEKMEMWKKGLLQKMFV